MLYYHVIVYCDLALEPVVPLLRVPGHELRHAALLHELSPS